MGRKLVTDFASGVLAALALLLSALPADAAEFRLRAGDLDAAMVATLESGSLTRTALGTEGARSGDVVAAARADYAQLLGLLYAQGYFGAAVQISIDGVEAAGISTFTPPDRIDRVTVVVAAGRKFRFGRVAIAPLPPRAVLPEGSASGDTATTGAIRDAAAAAIAAWRAAGHAKARVTAQDITADHAARRVNVALRIDPGPRLTFGALTVEGARTMRIARIIKIAGLPQGAMFSPAEVELAADRLRRTGTFRAVTLAEDAEPGPDGQLGFTAQLAEARRHRYGIGGDFSTLTGFGVQGFWLHRNLLGGAERLRIDASAGGIGDRLSGIDYRLGVAFTRPATFRADTDLTLGAGLEQLSAIDHSSRAATARIGLERRFGNRMTASAGLAFRAAATIDGFGRRLFRLTSIPIAATYDARNKRLEPTRGAYGAATLEPFGGSVAGVRMTADLRTYRALWAKGVFAVRLQMGSLVGPSVAGAPPDFLFHSGGGGTVRGQPYQSLGTASGGISAGGRSLAVLSAEYRHRASDKIGIVGFFDVGMVGASSLPFGGGASHAGAGLGLRYATGIGPIRVDVAAPVAGTTGRGLALYIGIGEAY